MQNKNLNTLQRIVFPDTDFEDNIDLFYRKKDDTQSFFDKGLKSVRKYKFDTWMNLFAAKKWYDYCELGNLFLKITASGKTRVEIVGHNLNVAFGVISEVLEVYDFDFENSEETHTICIENAQKYDGISFNIIQEKDNESKFYGGQWCTDIEKKRTNQLAIVTCTYKREDYIKKTVAKFTHFMKANKDLSGKMHLYVVDNGKTLPVSLSTENVSIIPNMNAGGAGGFARGLMEANDNNYSRVLFMDDDVEIFPESFFRTLTLSEYFKEEYKDSFINGPMMNLYNKYEMFENLAVYDDNFWVSPYRGNLFVDNIYNIFKTIQIDRTDFENHYINGAWWYFCSSLEKVKEQYPVPVFFRCDDIEWGWRNRGSQIVNINGICLWHAPFMYRINKVTEYYYGMRNFALLCTLYVKEGKMRTINAYKNKFNYLLSIYDYVGAEILLESLTDLLKGEESFVENPEKQFARINETGKKSVAISVPSINELEFARDYKINTATLKFKLKEKIYRFTNKGKFLPTRFYRNRMGIATSWFTPPPLLYTKKATFSIQCLQ